MTMQEFHQLNEMEKLSAIMQSGILRTQNRKGGLRIFIYRFESFYVSISYNLIDDQLTGISSFAEGNNLVPEYRRKTSVVNPAEREYETPEC